MNIFLTGGTGFIGSHLIPALLKNNHSVVCLVRSNDKGIELKKKYNVSYIVGDITNAETLNDIDVSVFDIVIHMAAMGHVSATSEEAFEAFTSINEGGTKNLISLFSKHTGLKKFIHFSSTAAMGPIEQPILNEKSIPNPVTPYQKSKQRSETYSLGKYNKDKFPTVVIRPCMVYGPGGYGEFYKFCKLMKKGVFPKVGLGKNLTPLVHVADVVQGTLKTIENGRPGEIYLITSKTSITMDDMHDYIMQAIGVKAPYLFVPKYLAFVGAKFIEIVSNFMGREPIVTYRNIRSTVVNRTFDITKAEKELGYKPSIKFQDGISETVHWYKSQNKL